jgi:hypothetical protein
MTGATYQAKISSEMLMGYGRVKCVAAGYTGGGTLHYNESRAGRAPHLPRPPGAGWGEGNGHGGGDLETV